MKKLTLLIEVDNGEQYEEYQSWIEEAYEVETDKSAKDLESDWKKHVCDVMFEHKITVNPHWFNIMTESKIKDHVLHKKLLHENSFLKWLKKTHKAKKISNVEVIHIN